MHKKSNLEKTIEYGIKGPPELKKEERSSFLGEFKERVIVAITISQVEEKGYYEEVFNAIKDPRAKKLIISRSVNLKFAKDYIDLARQNNLQFTIRASTEYKGNVGLIVVSDDAVNVENIFITGYEEQLKKLQIPENIIKAWREKLCDNCYEEVSNKAPAVTHNFFRLGFFDKLLGKKCKACNK